MPTKRHQTDLDRPGTRQLITKVLSAMSSYELVRLSNLVAAEMVARLYVPRVLWTSSGDAAQMHARLEDLATRGAVTGDPRGARTSPAPRARAGRASSSAAEQAEQTAAPPPVRVRGRGRGASRQAGPSRSDSHGQGPARAR